MQGTAFDAVSYAAGLTRMGFGRFVAATLIDVAPKALMATYLSGQAPQYTWMLLAVTGLTMGALTVAALLSRRK